jgi:hypothetical protein
LKDFAQVKILGPPCLTGLSRIYHRIPTRRDCQPVRSKPRLSTAEEVAWLRENIPAMEKAGIIDRVDSPWSAPSRFVRKKNNSLRLTHTFCPINDATIKSNYPMRRVEPILNNLMQPRFSMFWWTDASNGYWAVPVWPSHVIGVRFHFSAPEPARERVYNVRDLEVEHDVVVEHAVFSHPAMRSAQGCSCKIE